MELEHKTFRLDVKEAGDANFSGNASVAGVKDFYEEVVDEGAFTRTLKHKNGKVPLLADHMPDRRIGIAELEDKGNNLALDGFMNLEKQLAKDTLSDIRFNLKHKVPLGLSIGFETIKEAMVEGIRHLKEIALWEVSVVTFPANPKALVTGLKAAAWAQSHNISLELAGVIEYASHIDPAKMSAGTRSLFQAARDSFDALLKGIEDGSDPGGAHSRSIYDPDGLSGDPETQAMLDEFAEDMRKMREGA